MILEIAGDSRAAGLVRAEHSSLANHLAEQEFAALDRRLGVLVVSERARGFGDAADHEAVPRRQHLVVEAGPNALLANVVQRPLGSRDDLVQLIDRDRE